MAYHTIRRTSLGICAAGLAFVGTACTEQGYRTEVHSDEQGRVEVHRIPVDTPPAPPSPEPARPAAPAPPAPPSDKDLAEIESIWPQLNPADRQRVADMARRLAGQPQ